MDEMKEKGNGFRGDICKGSQGKSAKGERQVTVVRLPFNFTVKHRNMR